ncbi:MAG: imidazole glycerol phosphate synthase subunit HisH [Candidatus Omnitrophica bacterium]|nr:imidazole glycerol phosphate synthase subunit HisH [Candidatus Omnitrophota bacterium]
MIAIIDYGMGNIHSVNKALQNLGAKTLVTNKPADIQAAEKVVLPGVGAFDDAMQELKRQGLVPAILESINSKKPFLGICLGMQLLFPKSQEAKRELGLGAVKGVVKKFPAKLGLKVPHIGWNQLKKATAECPLLKDIPDSSYVYFCHSYYPQPKDKSVVAATCDYGVNFSAIIWKDNLFGAQFHPEKSQSVGLKILENFVKLC